MARSGRMESNLTLGNWCLVTMALEIFTWVKHIPGNRRLLIKPVKAQRLMPVTAYPSLSYGWHSVFSV